MGDVSLVIRREQQFLVHSFLYYKLDESLICDSKYDSICKELLQYKDHVCIKYPELLKGLGESGSGFYIKKYPEPIITTAFHLLYNNKKSNPNFKETFKEFVERRGYALIKNEQGKSNG